MFVIAKTVRELNTFVYAASSWLVGRLPLSETFVCARLTSAEKGPLGRVSGRWTNMDGLFVQRRPILYSEVK